MDGMMSALRLRSTCFASVLLRACTFGFELAGYPPKEQASMANCGHLTVLIVCILGVFV